MQPGRTLEGRSASFPGEVGTGRCFLPCGQPFLVSAENLPRVKDGGTGGNDALKLFSILAGDARKSFFNHPDSGAEEKMTALGSCSRILSVF